MHSFDCWWLALEMGCHYLIRMIASKLMRHSIGDAFRVWISDEARKVLWTHCARQRLSLRKMFIVHCAGLLCVDLCQINQTHLRGGRRIVQILQTRPAEWKRRPNQFDWMEKESAAKCLLNVGWKRENLKYIWEHRTLLAQPRKTHHHFYCACCWWWKFFVRFFPAAMLLLLTVFYKYSRIRFHSYAVETVAVCSFVISVQSRRCSALTIFNSIQSV